MSNRRILSLWFPRLGAERLIRAEPHLAGRPVVSVQEDGPARRLAALSAEATQAGLYRGQPLRDAHAMCAALVARAADPRQEAAFLGALHRWAGKFSPWVSAQPPDALVIDLTGCAHLFGGEAALCAQVTQDCADLGLTVQAGIADTLGAAWALARFTAQAAEGAGGRSGDAIDQEARATRARAGKRRHWERGGAAPTGPQGPLPEGAIAAPGKTWGALSPLPVAALRLEPTVVEQLTRLGLRRVGDLLGQPRAGLARRFGRGLVDRLDQALGAAPEPVSPAAPPERFAIRISFPDPIGLEEDVAEAVSRLLERLCARLRARGRGARALRLEAHRADHAMQWETVLTAVASDDPHRLMPLVRLKIPALEAGPGFDMLRLEAVRHEALHARTVAGHLEAAEQGRQKLGGDAGLDDLIGRLGARLGMEAITRRHPGSSHLPEKGAQVLAAAWAGPARDWPVPAAPRPLTLWPPEPVTAPDSPDPPERFRWRGRDWERSGAEGPERIAPEWWLDEPAWRSGARDYWRLETTRGDRLWLFYAHGAALSPGWFCHGAFA
ncbi:Y-family DNA polymerase [Pseudoponticoccus marisrubri]|uniref:DNA-directed DNA polymerase n=1 Tax=Pseudoponticoccus marisrubri TaxID=1685382 RepID=A0A0W7WG67_9RHOB|nr:DNA polymerase Y family protein [Pseudoponticoccus marisrubri]KUF09492.1 DNA methylase [Pseudoponticoccus marisrubri]